MTYVKHFFLGLGLLVALGSGLNLLVDPFDIFDMPRIERFNTHKSIGTTRLAKPLQITVRKPDTVILGTSRCMSGIDPKDVADGGVYNLSVAGALAGEMTTLARHAAETTPMRRLILCFDFVAFNDSRSVREGFYNDVFGEYGWLRSLPRTLFSYAALKRSRDTLRNSMRGKPLDYRSDGFRPFQADPRMSARDVMISPLASFLSPGGAYRDFPGFTRKLAAFSPLLRDLRPRGIKVDLAIPPVHATMLEAIDHAGLWPMFEDWKRGVTALCVEAGIRCWDFAGFNAVTTVPLDRAEGRYSDASHFTPDVGRRMIRIIDGNEDATGFGDLLTPDAIEDHLAAVRAARSIYRRSNPEDTALVRGIAAQYGLPR